LTAVCASLLAVTAVGCGSDDGNGAGGSYCDDVAAVRASFVGLLKNTLHQQAFDKLLDDLHTIRDEAPPGVKDDWAAFSSAADRFNTELDENGMTINDAVRMQQTGQMEHGPEMDRLMAAAHDLGSLRVAEAQGAIATEAKKDCGVDFD
jgi:hypothetical protein